jgi:D-serine deaminase-like pyridoxal phosphate-dependent protein
MFTTLETPVPIVDLDRMAANLDRMATYTAQHHLALRPHCKTHKSPIVAAEQVRRGAKGLTCATVREAEVLMEASPDILLAYPPLGGRAARLAALPAHVRLRVALDSREAAALLADAFATAGREIEVLIEVDLGMHRVGVQSAGDAVELAKYLRRFSSLRYAGIAFYPGHIRQDVAEQDAEVASLGRRLTELLERLDSAGVPPAIVSGGSTPTAWRSHELPGITEVRPGTYVYNDRTTAEIGACGWDDCALTVLATVVSTAVPGQAVIDAGSKALAREPLRSDGAGFGVLLDRPEVVVKGMSEEHGLLDLAGSDWKPEIGEWVRVIPNHVCAVVHLFDRVVTVRGDALQGEMPVSARGRG